MTTLKPTTKIHSNKELQDIAGAIIYVRFR